MGRTNETPEQKFDEALEYLQKLRRSDYSPLNYFILG
jgi:hypothetical protein